MFFLGSFPLWVGILGIIVIVGAVAISTPIFLSVGVVALICFLPESARPVAFLIFLSFLGGMTVGALINEVIPVFEKGYLNPILVLILLLGCFEIATYGSVYFLDNWMFDSNGSTEAVIVAMDTKNRELVDTAAHYMYIFYAILNVPLVILWLLSLFLPINHSQGNS